MLICEKDTIKTLEISDLYPLEYFSVPKNEGWRIDILNKLIETKLDNTEVPGFSSQEIEEMINFVCIS